MFIFLVTYLLHFLIGPMKCCTHLTLVVTVKSMELVPKINLLAVLVFCQTSSNTDLISNVIMGIFLSVN